MIDFTKPVQTRDGRPVRILCTDLLGHQPIAGAIKQSDHREDLATWTSSGHFHNDEGAFSYADLINAPQRHKHADLMIAYANDTSLVIEYRVDSEDDWYPMKCPSWNKHYEYRIRPNR